MFWEPEIPIIGANMASDAPDREPASGENLLERAKPLFYEIDINIGHTLPRSLKISFNQLFFLNLREDNPSLVHLPRGGGRYKDWFGRLRSKLREVEVGMNSCFYHAHNIEIIENKLVDIAISHLPGLNMKIGTNISGGRIEKLSFEYYAFLFSMQRTLSYYAASIGSYFQIDINRVRKLSARIENVNPTSVSKNICKRIGNAEQDFPGSFGSRSDLKSQRDVLAHHKNVDVGTLNMLRTADGYRVFLAGGGENLDNIPAILIGKDSARILSLSPVLKKRLMALEKLVMGSCWDMGLLASPKVGGKSDNVRYSGI